MRKGTRRCQSHVSQVLHSRSRCPQCSHSQRLLSKRLRRPMHRPTRSRGAGSPFRRCTLSSRSSHAASSWPMAWSSSCRKTTSCRSSMALCSFAEAAATSPRRRSAWSLSTARAGAPAAARRPAATLLDTQLGGEGGTDRDRRRPGVDVAYTGPASRVTSTLSLVRRWICCCIPPSMNRSSNSPSASPRHASHAATTRRLPSPPARRSSSSTARTVPMRASRSTPPSPP